MNEDSYLYFLLNKNLITEPDKDNILTLFNNTQTYNYNDIFSAEDLTYDIYPQLPLKRRTIINTYGGHYYAKGIVISKSNKRLYKLWFVNKENPATNDFCIQMHKEFYFHNIFFNNTDKLVIPKTYNKGKIILDNEILFFYEMEYYDTKNYIHNLLNATDVKLIDKFKKVKHYYDMLTEYSTTVIPALETKINIFHHDYPDFTDFPGVCDFHIPDMDPDMDPDAICDLEDHFRWSALHIINVHNILSYEGKCILIDYEDCTRSEAGPMLIKKTHDTLKQYLRQKYS